jgi:hypothetical protein
MSPPASGWRWRLQASSAASSPVSTRLCEDGSGLAVADGTILLEERFRGRLIDVRGTPWRWRLSLSDVASRVLPPSVVLIGLSALILAP